MRLLNERAQVRGFIQIGRDPRGSITGHAAKMQAAAQALDPESATAADIAAALGTDVWVCQLHCEACRGLSWDVVEIDQQYGECVPVRICVACLRKAVALVESEAPPAAPIVDPVRLAITVAIRAHEYHLDKAERPYIDHPLRVMERMPADDLEGRVVAVLHDVLEDSEITAQDLRQMGFSERIITALERLTHRRDEPYEEYLRRVAGDELTRRVKLADIADNADEGRLALLSEAEAARLREKYARARAVLEGEAPA